MTRPSVLLLLATAVLASGCLAGPRYVPETVASSQQRIGIPRTSDSSRAFFDSLAVARRADTARIAATPAVRRMAAVDSLT